MGGKGPDEETYVGNGVDARCAGTVSPEGMKTDEVLGSRDPHRHIRPFRPRRE
jgi:hypothetical protein